MIKQIHNLKQDSEDWHYFRSNHDGASEAGPMLGISPTTKRDELLHIKKIGLPKEFSDFVEQRIFAEGHRVEPLARELVEKHIGDDLYPVVYSLGRLSASCDGITMDETIAFECKQFNGRLFDGVVAGVVPDYHMAQCQQIMMVTGANQVYFTVSDGTEENTAWTIVEPSQEWFDRINDGWNQFNLDLESFVIVEPVAEVVAEAIPQLPALSVITRGEVVQSNLPQFKQAAIGFIKSVNTDLQTDQDFVNAKAFVKFAQDGEERLEAQKSAILAQTSDIELAIRTIDDVKAELRAKRLEVDKLVKTREQTIKIEIKLAGETEWLKHKTDLQSGIKGIQLIVTDPDLAGAMKNKRTIDSLRNAVNTEVANAKVSATQIARDISDKLKFMADNASEHRFLFNDLQTIIYRPFDDLQLIVSTRIEQHKAQEAEKLEAERQRIAAEEKARLEQEIKPNTTDCSTLCAPHDELCLITESGDCDAKAVPEKPVLEAKPKQIPNRDALVLVVADSMQVEKITAEAWLLAAFTGETVESLKKKARDYHESAAHADNSVVYKSEMAIANKYYALAKALVA